MNKKQRRLKRRQITPPTFRPGDRCLFLYPRFPYFGITDQTMTPHCVDISRIIDHVSEPMDPAEFEDDPLLLRSRWRVFGIECETGAPVSFFHSHMQHLQIIGHVG